MSLRPLTGFTPRGQEPVVGLRLEGAALPAMRPLRWFDWVGMAPRGAPPSHEAPTAAPPPGMAPAVLHMADLAAVAEAMRANAEAMTQAHARFLEGQAHKQQQLEAAMQRLMGLVGE